MVIEPFLWPLLSLNERVFLVFWTSSSSFAVHTVSTNSKTLNMIPLTDKRSRHPEQYSELAMEIDTYISYFICKNFYIENKFIIFILFRFLLLIAFTTIYRSKKLNSESL